MANLCWLADRNIRSPIGGLSVTTGIFDSLRHAITEKHMCVMKHNEGLLKDKLLCKLGRSKTDCKKIWRTCNYIFYVHEKAAGAHYDN